MKIHQSSKIEDGAWFGQALFSSLAVVFRLDVRGPDPQPRAATIKILYQLGDLERNQAECLPIRIQQRSILYLNHDNVFRSPML